MTTTYHFSVNGTLAPTNYLMTVSFQARAKP
jgi:hypothetical protein